MSDSSHMPGTPGWHGASTMDWCFDFSLVENAFVHNLVPRAMMGRLTASNESQWTVLKHLAALPLDEFVPRLTNVFDDAPSLASFLQVAGAVMIDIAAHVNNPGVVEYLFDSGCSGVRNCTASIGDGLPHAAREDATPYDGMPLHYLAEYGHDALITKIAARHGIAHLHLRFNGETPLHRAITHHQNKTALTILSLDPSTYFDPCRMNGDLHWLCDKAKNPEMTHALRALDASRAAREVLEEFSGSFIIRSEGRQCLS